MTLNIEFFAWHISAAKTLPLASIKSGYEGFYSFWKEKKGFIFNIVAAVFMQQSYETLPGDSLRQSYFQVCRGSAGRGTRRASCAWPPRDTWHWIFCWTSSHSSDIATALRHSWPSETQCFLKTVNTNQKSDKWFICEIWKYDSGEQSYFSKSLDTKSNCNQRIQHALPQYDPWHLPGWTGIHTPHIATDYQHSTDSHQHWLKEEKESKLTFIVHSLVNSCGS